MKEKLHNIILALKAKWLVLIAFAVTLVPALPELFDQLQAVDYSNLSIKGIACAVGLILVRFIALRALSAFI